MPFASPREIQPMGRFNYSLRTLLATVAALGIGAALWMAEPSWQIGLVETLFLICVPASAVILSVNSSGKARAWWVGIAAGCIFGINLYLPSDAGVVNVFTLYANPNPAATPLARLQAIAKSLSSEFQVLLLLWSFAPVVGLLCVFTHWLLIRPPQGPQD